MQERKVEKNEHSLSQDDIRLRRVRLEEALIAFESNLLMDIRVYLKKFKLEHLLSDAEEILSRVKIIALKNAGNYDPECSAKAWLRQVAFHTVQHLYRAEKNRIPIDSVNETALKLGYGGDIEGASESELFDYLREKSLKQFFRQQMSVDEILSVVSESDRRILKMRFVDGLSTKEIAAELGTGEGAADVRFARAKDRLRKKFLEQ